MTPTSRRRRTTLVAVLAFLSTLLIPSLVPSLATTSQAATPITVASAVATQNGSTATVRGYVVGQPTATNTVVTSNYPNDYALALADSPTETSTAKMVYVQISSGFRATYGLRTNPSLKGQQLDVTGTLSAYFSHPGLTSTTAFAKVGGTTPPPTGGRALRQHVLRERDRQVRHRAPHRPAHDHQDPDEADLRPGLGGAEGHRPGPGQQQQRHRDLLRPLDRQDPNGGGVDDWNREHVWAKSHGDFGTATGPGTDVHHLRPEDVTVNSTRGNKDFDNGGTAVSQCGDCWTDADSFEPRDAVKGDVARMIFYMAVRYEGDDGWPDLEPNQSTSNGTAPYIGRLSVLLAWNAADPPDAFEMRRNDRIYTAWQHNRNPFIDHPEWATSIFG